MAASSGITTWVLHPYAGAIVAMLMAVLPALPSVTIPPGRSWPDSRACAINHRDNLKADTVMT